MALKLYFDVISPPCRALLIVLNHSKVPYQSCPIALRKGEHLSEEFKQVTRFQKVPAIQDADFALTESIAILRYLAKAHQLPDHWYPKESREQAKVDEFLEWYHANIRSPSMEHLRVRWITPLLTGEQPNPEKVAKFEKALTRAFSNFETLWLHKGPFIVGDKVSAADIWAACELEQSRLTNLDPEKGRPALSGWLNNVRKTVSPYYEEAHSILNKMIGKI